jgi:hypothetical protein
MRQESCEARTALPVARRYWTKRRAVWCTLRPAMRPLLPILLAVLLALVASAADAAPRLDGLPRAPHAGDVVHLEWSGLGRDVREVELELSLDGSRWVRISPEMEARDGRFDWHVPEWASGIARLRLRSGGELFERVAVVSEAFAIPAHGRAPQLECSGEWWDVVVAGPAWPQAQVVLACARWLETSAEPESDAGAIEARAPHVAWASGSDPNDRDRVADRAPHNRTPLHLPLRI